MAMTDATSGVPGGITGAELATAAFASKSFGKGGYEPAEVDAFLSRSGAAVDRLNARLAQAEQALAQARARIQQLRDRIDRDSRSSEVEQAVGMLTTAQLTADNTIAHADEYSAKVMAEARELYETTRRNASVLEQETESKSRAVFEDAMRRAEAVERENEVRVAELTLTAEIAQEELDGQTAYLRTLRDATRTQMEKFLEGMLDHLSDQYGRAHPIAAQAANGGVAGAVTAGATSGAKSGASVRRPRRTQRVGARPAAVAGRPTAATPDRRRQGAAPASAQGPVRGSAGEPPTIPPPRLPRPSTPAPAGRPVDTSVTD
jgi:DivIVA domain-containing protein